MPASGAFSTEFAQVIDLNRLGALVTKTVSREYRIGNPPPRVAELECGMINSIGLPTKGLEYFLEHQLPEYATLQAAGRRAASPSTTTEDFAAMARDVSVPSVDVIELNISCPTRQPGGGNFALNEDNTYQVVKPCARRPKAALGEALAQRRRDHRSRRSRREGRRRCHYRLEHDPRPQDQHRHAQAVHRQRLWRHLGPRHEADHHAHGAPVLARR